MAGLIIGGGNNSSGLRIGGSGNAVAKNGTPTVDMKTSLVAGLSATRKAAQDIIAFKQKPILIYMILDVTSSRSTTRASMKPHERELATKIRALGDVSNPIIVKGVYHRGGQSSAPIPLNDEKAIMNFFDTSPVGGTTDIATGLSYYLNDPADAIVSLGILIGDSDDGDSADNLKSISAKLKAKHRPLIVAWENTGDTDFCQSTAPALAAASEGLSFEVSKHPEELTILMSNIRQGLREAMEQMARRTATPPNFDFGGTSATKALSARITERLLLAGPKV